MMVLCKQVEAVFSICYAYDYVHARKNLGSQYNCKSSVCWDNQPD